MKLPAPVAYDWESLRPWCIWALDLFLSYASSEATEEAFHHFWAEYNSCVPNWRKVKKIPNDAVRLIVQSITGDTIEAVTTRNALPGDFADAVKLARAERELLLKDLSPDETWRQIVEFENRLSQG